MRLHDWSGFAALGALVLALIELVRGELLWASAWFVSFAAAAGLTRYWSLTHPGPMPHVLGWTLRFPRGKHSPEHLREILRPRNGERLLEVGPGIGIHSLPVAMALAPDGRLDIFDIQQEMLDDVMRKAAGAGITNITPQQGDACELPYADASFDGACLIGVLGEIPDGDGALRELRRVLKRDGRLIVGEVFFDPDFVYLSTLVKRTADAGFSFETKVGGSLSYLARFRAR